MCLHLSLCSYLDNVWYGVYLDCTFRSFKCLERVMYVLMNPRMKRKEMDVCVRKTGGDG